MKLILKNSSVVVSKFNGTLWWKGQLTSNNSSNRDFTSEALEAVSVGDRFLILIKGDAASNPSGDNLVYLRSNTGVISNTPVINVPFPTEEYDRYELTVETAYSAPTLHIYTGIDIDRRRVFDVKIYKME